MSALKNSGLQKKAKGWMALRGNWGRKKRSGIGSRNVTPIHHSLFFSDKYVGEQGPASFNDMAFTKLNGEKFTKKSIPKIDENDIDNFLALLNNQA